MTARVSFVARARDAGLALAWIVAFAALGIGVSWALTELPLRPGARWDLAWGSFLSVLAFGLATWLVGRLAERRSWEDLGWRPRTGAPRGFLVGVVSGAVMAALAVGLAVTAGRAAVSMRVEWTAWGAAAVPLALGLLLAALTEELIFRGYPLRRLAHAIGATPATVCIAIGFGLAHLGNPSATWFSTINVALAGVWLACGFFSPGGMPLAWGAHFGWNAALALVFATPVSGYAFPVPAFAYRPGPHGWIDGGAFGPEGGVVATLVMVAGIAGLIAWSRRAGASVVSAVA